MIGKVDLCIRRGVAVRVCGLFSDIGRIDFGFRHADNSIVVNMLIAIMRQLLTSCPKLEED